VSSFDDIHLFFDPRSFILPPPDPRTGGVYNLKFDVIVWKERDPPLIFDEHNDEYFTVRR